MSQGSTCSCEQVFPETELLPLPLYIAAPSGGRVLTAATWRPRVPSSVCTVLAQDMQFTLCEHDSCQDGNCSAAPRALPGLLAYRMVLGGRQPYQQG